MSEDKVEEMLDRAVKEIDPSYEVAINFEKALI